MTFTPGSVTSTYSTLATSKTFTAATGAYGTITYAITGGDKTGFSLSSASSTTINAVAKQGAKTSYSIKITATDSGDKNHEAKDIEATLTWTIEKATPTVS